MSLIYAITIFVVALGIISWAAFNMDKSFYDRSWVFRRHPLVDSLIIALGFLLLLLSLYFVSRTSILLTAIGVLLLVATLTYAVRTHTLKYRIKWIYTEYKKIRRVNPTLSELESLKMVSISYFLYTGMSIKEIDIISPKVFSRIKASPMKEALLQLPYLLMQFSDPALSSVDPYHDIKKANKITEKILGLSQTIYPQFFDEV